jgi:flagellar biosynthesis/type III secretory pathway M-ring protein FliF/YscJ
VEITVTGWLGIFLLGFVLPVATFCIVVALIIWRRKRARAQRKLQEEQEQWALMAQEHVVQETWRSGDLRGDLGQGRAGPIELQGGVGGVQAQRQPQQLDGFVAPALTGYDGMPLEMPAQTVMR